MGHDVYIKQPILHFQTYCNAVKFIVCCTFESQSFMWRYDSPLTNQNPESNNSAVV